LTLVLQILLAIVVLVGLITVIMSIKNWHWAQMLLLLAIFLSSLGTLVLGLEVYRIHRNWRAGIPALEQNIAREEAQREALTLGAAASMASTVFAEVPPLLAAEERMPGLDVWIARLQDVYRQRGRAWRGVTPSDAVNPDTDRVPVRIENPQPHGLEQDTIVYVFEEGAPNPANPQEGAQYLGEFRVVQVSPDGAVLESTVDLDNRTGNRLAGSQGPWELYDRMPMDRHELFAGMTEEQLRQLLPEASVDAYIRQGQTVDKPANVEAFNPTIAMFDEQDNRVGPENAANAVRWAFERPLRDYAYLFAAANRIAVALNAEQMALVEDNKKLEASLEIAKKLGELRTEEKTALAGDLQNMKRDREVIEGHLATVQRVLANVQAKVTELLAETAQLRDQLKAKQERQLQELDRTAPAPGSVFLNATP
jgi:predicted DCC family thiol-disulfide oxidoreductase YuxK